ncbi:MAG: TRAP transporter substrate-binding protein DctP [Alcaligenaceae bacterium]|nr:TRAP transporter substrate-binding protein DctP [Alcaligenaceae bacterium]
MSNTVNRSRREFVQKSAVTLGAPALGSMLFTRPALAADEMKSVIYFTPTYIGIIRAARGFAEQFNTAIGGSKNLKLYDSGRLLTADQQLPGLRAGNIDLMFHATSYVTRSLPILGILGLPGIVGELYQHPERLRIGSPLFNLINKSLAKDNLYMLSCGGGVLEPEYIWGNKETPIRSLSDLRGKKMRIASFEATELLEGYGVTSVRITSAETYVALQRGTVDAATANVATVAGRSLNEQLGFCYKMPTTAYDVAPFVLKSTWDKFNDKTKDALQTAAQWYDQNTVEYCNHTVYPDTFWPKVLNSGVQVIEPDKADIEDFNASAQKVWGPWKKSVGEEIGAHAIDLALGKA